MRYPIFIEKGTRSTAFGVVIPDLPGCFSAGDTLDEALANAEEAAAAWIDAALDDDMAIPAPSAVDTWLADYPGWITGFVTVDPALLDNSIARVNITLPKRVLKRLDSKAKAAGESRSSYIAHMTISY